MTTPNRLHHKSLKPYLPGKGPTFHIETWDTGRYDKRGQTIIRYELLKLDRGLGTIIFEGEDFCGSPLHADDSPETLRSLLSFLTLRPGDTDPSYFKDYTKEQLDFANNHAEAIANAYVYTENA